MTARMVVSAAVVSADPDLITKAAEVLSRACAGLALEGLEVDVHMETEEEDDGYEPLPPPTLDDLLGEG